MQTLQSGTVPTRKFGIYLGTRQAQHSKATGTSVQSTYDQDNGGIDFGAAEMDREAQDIEPGDSLAECRVPSIANFRKPGDVPRDSEAWQSEVEQNQERKDCVAQIARCQREVGRFAKALEKSAQATAARKSAAVALRRAA